MANTKVLLKRAIPFGLSLLAWLAPSVAGAVCGVPTVSPGFVASCPGGAPYATSTPCAVSCNTANGYVGAPSAATITCQADGTWSPSPASLTGCSLWNCGAAPTQTGYVLTGSGTTFGSTRTVSCNSATGYTGSATPASITCTLTGWTASTFAGCALADCGPYSAPPGYTASCSGTTFGSTCSLSCDAANGYLGAPSSATSTCQSNGTWSPSGASLTGCALANCGTYNAPAGYAVSSCTGTTFGSTCSLSCNAANGYVGTPSSATSTCEGDGTWSPAGASLTGCFLKDCGTPPMQPGYVVSGSSTTFGSTWSVSCDGASGYTGSAVPGSIACTLSGWSATTFAGCALANCGAYNAPAGYTVSSCTGTTFGSTCSLSCNAANGYVGTPSSATTTCEGDGTWSPAGPSLTGCSLKDCSTPPMQPGYVVSGSSTTFGSTWSVSCDGASGYTGSAVPGSIACTVSGWSATTFAGCALANCGAYSAPSGYAASCTGTTFGSTCSLSCNAANGYVGTPSSATSTCQLDGTWSAAGSSLTGCSLKDCGAAPLQAGFEVSCDKTTYGGTCVAACASAEGYVGSPAPGSITCGMSGWSQPGFAGCGLAECGAYAAPAGYAIQCPDTTWGSTCTIGCDAANGYVGMVTVSTSTCQLDQTWSAPAASLAGCALKDCGALPAQAGYQVTCTASTFGGQCQASCDSATGYVGTASPTTAACGVSGWSATSFTGCASANCGALTPPAGYVTVCSGQAFGDACAISCDAAAGYIGTPSATTSACRIDQTWSVAGSSLTGCVRATCAAQTPPTGYSVSCTGQHAGDTCTVGCDTVHGWVGTPSTTSTACGIDQQWSANLASLTGCSLAQCTAPTLVKAIVSCSGSGFGDACGVACDQQNGYVGIPSVVAATCGVAGWNPDLAKADEACCDATAYEAENHVVLDCGAPGDPCTLSCASGYQSATALAPTAVTCEAGSFSAVPTDADRCRRECEPIVDAGHVATCTGALEGDVCGFACPEGYVQQAIAATATCGADGQWAFDAALPDCAPVQCGPLALANADGSDCDAHPAYGQACVVACLPGFAGAPTATCSLAGTWTTAGACAAVDCGALTFANAKVDDCTAHPASNQACTLTCLEGFTGTPGALCTVAGGWTRSGSCDPIPCYPSPATNGQDCGAAGQVCLGGQCATPEAGQICALPAALEPGSKGVFGVGGHHDLLSVGQCPGQVEPGQDLFLSAQVAAGEYTVAITAPGVDLQAYVLDGCASATCTPLDLKQEGTSQTATLSTQDGTLLLAVHVREAPTGAGLEVTLTPADDGSTESSGCGCATASASGSTLSLLFVLAMGLAVRRRVR